MPQTWPPRSFEPEALAVTRSYQPFRIDPPLLIAAALLVGFPSFARGGLVVDLRLAETGVKQMIVTGADVGRRIPINIYAVVTGSDPDASEGFASAMGSFISSRDPNGGVLGQIHPAGDLDAATLTTVLPAISPYNHQGTRGESKDIPLPGDSIGDGVIDLGDPVRRADVGQLVAFNAPSLQVTSGTVVPNGREFHLGRVEFEVGVIQGLGDTAIQWYFRQSPDGGPAVEAAHFRQDGLILQGLTGEIGIGAPVRFTVVPEPAASLIIPIAMATLMCRRLRSE